MRKITALSVTNMIILWNITTWDILEILFMGVICYVLEVWVCILVKEFLQHYTEWKLAEIRRTERSAARKRRRENYRDYNLRQMEEDEWYEVPLDLVM